MTNDLIQLRHQHQMTTIRLRSLEEEISQKVKEGNKLIKRQQELKLRIMELENGQNLRNG